MKHTKDINDILVECNSFIKSSRHMRSYIVMIHIQVKTPQSE